MSGHCRGRARRLYSHQDAAHKPRTGPLPAYPAPAMVGRGHAGSSEPGRWTV